MVGSGTPGIGKSVFYRREHPDVPIVTGSFDEPLFPVG